MEPRSPSYEELAVLVVGLTSQLERAHARIAELEARGRDSLSWPHRDGLKWLHQEEVFACCDGLIWPHFADTPGRL